MASIKVNSKMTQPHDESCDIVSFIVEWINPKKYRFFTQLKCRKPQLSAKHLLTRKPALTANVQAAWAITQLWRCEIMLMLQQFALGKVFKGRSKMAPEHFILAKYKRAGKSSRAVRVTSFMYIPDLPA